MAIRKINLCGHKNEALDALGFETYGPLHVDLGDPDLFDKLVEKVLKDMIGIESGDKVILAPPKLTMLSILLLAAINGLTGNWPDIVGLVNTEEGFVPGQIWKLQELRNKVGRQGREDLVRL